MEYDRLTEKMRTEQMFTPGKEFDKALDLRDESKLGQVPTWSFSTLKDFEQCPYRVYLAKVAKAPRTSSTAADRGLRVHAAAEAFVRGDEEELIRELLSFQIGMHRLREFYLKGLVQMEERWGFTRDWEPCEWEDDKLWAKMMLDAIVMDGEDSCFIIDFKTGKKKGNEIKHTDQGLTYAVGTIMKYPKVQFCQVEFWYTDEKEKLIKTYTREQLMLLIPHLEERAHTLTTCVEFEPKPSAQNCKWCSHKETDTCDYAEGL